MSYMDFSSTSHWNGDGVGGTRETQKQADRIRRDRRLKQNVNMLKRIREREENNE